MLRIHLGQANSLPNGADEALITDKRRELEDALQALTRRADWLMNRPDVDPAPLSTEAG